MRTYVLEPSRKQPLYEQLYRAIKNDILSGVLRGGEKLPSKRALAEHLTISRITVENAYEQLLTEGYVTAKERSGYFVEQLDALPEPPKAALSSTASQPDFPQSPPAASAAMFPFSIWARLMRSVLLEQRELLLRPAPNTGLLQLRQAIAGMLQRSRGIQVSPACIVVGAGAEYLYTLLIQLLGRQLCYGLEDPGHQKIRKIYAANQVSIRPLSMDNSGVLPEAPEQAGIQVLHLSPGHQYPTGAVMPIARRQQLMAWLAGGEDRWLIEDDYDSEFRFSGKLIPTMFSMDASGHVLYLNTFSKTITPALRISYLILPESLMEKYQAALGFYSCTVPSMEQLTLAKFLDEGYFEKHVSRMKRRYRTIHDRFLSLLNESPCKAQISVRGAEAGLHLLLRLDTSLTDQALEQQLTLAGFPVSSLRRFQMVPSEAGDSWLVLPFGDLEEQDLPHLIEALESVCNKEATP